MDRTRSTSAKSEASVKAADALSAGSSLQRDQFVKQVVTPTATDRFIKLHDLLTERYGDRVVDVTPTGDIDELLKDTDAAQEGDFIVIHDARLLLPTYALLLAKAAHSARIYAPGQPDVPGRQVAHLVTTEKKEVAHYLDGLGKDPRLPATVWALERGQSKPRYSFLVPLRYSKLSDSPSLMSGNVTILGKVVRRVFPPDPRTTTETFRDDSYFDIETATRYNAALKPRSPAFLRALGLSGKATGADGGELKPRSIVNWTARVNSPGMLVIPIAMYY